MSLKAWEKRVLRAPGATARVAEIEEELRLAAGLTALREQAGFSQQELARRMGISQPRVAAIEQSRNVTIEVLEQYRPGLGCAEVVRDEHEPFPLKTNFRGICSTESNPTILGCYMAILLWVGGPPAFVALRSEILAANDEFAREGLLALARREKAGQKVVERVSVHSAGLWLDRLDQLLVRFMSVYGIRLLRLAIAIVYLWFGALKLTNVSPAGELVVRTVFWLPPSIALRFIGGWEVLIGVGLLFSHPLVLRITLFLLWLQIAGTFQIFFLLPGETFQGGNPLLPTLEGQYAIKNIVLITAGLVIGSTVRRARTLRGRWPEAP